MLRIALHHPESGVSFLGPSLDVGSQWNMREAIGGAVQKVAKRMNLPEVAIMTEHNDFFIIIKEDFQDEFSKKVQ